MYFAHGHQQPISKLRILNFPDFFQSDSLLQKSNEWTKKTCYNYSKDSWKSRLLISELEVESGEQDGNLQLSGGLIFVEVPLGLSCMSSGQYSIANEHSMIRKFTIIIIAKSLEDFMFGYDIVSSYLSLRARHNDFWNWFYKLYVDFTL